MLIHIYIYIHTYVYIYIYIHIHTYVYEESTPPSQPLLSLFICVVSAQTASQWRDWVCEGLRVAGRCFECCCLPWSVGVAADGVAGSFGSSASWLRCLGWLCPVSSASLGVECRFWVLLLGGACQCFHRWSSGQRAVC